MATLEKVTVPPRADAAPTDVAAIDSAAELDVAAKLQQTVKAAREALGSDQQKLASEVNRLLAALNAAKGPAAAAELIQSLLEGRSLNELVDADGRTCRSVAVEQLLALGFPYALEVSPADLSHHRIVEREHGIFGRLMLVLASAGVIAAPVIDQAKHLVSDGVHVDAPLLLSVAYVATTLAALWSVWRYKPASPRGTLARRILTGAGALGLLAGLAGVLAMGLAGAAALLASIVLVPPSVTEEPR